MSDGKEDVVAQSKAPKRKVALFLVYNGEGFQGMQRNPGQRTIEGELHAAIVAAGGISVANAEEFSKVGWSRAARTDKGVSAVGQVVSLKLCIHQDVLSRINAALPPAVQALGVRRVTTGFDARKLCDRRRYEYIMPAFAFSQNKAAADGNAQRHDSTHDGAARADALRSAAPDGGESADERGDSANGAQPSVSTAGQFDGGCTKRLSKILVQYCGTHSFHNFTEKMSAGTPTAKRYVISCECEGTFLIQGQQWVRIHIVGQSFVMYQIRKMVGLAVAEFRGTAPPGSIKAALESKRRLEVPMAPALGLMLDECCFDSYNSRWAQGREVLSLSDWADNVAAFKHEQLYPQIAAKDAQERVTDLWLRGLNEQKYHFSRWVKQAVAPKQPAPTKAAEAKPQIGVKRKAPSPDVATEVGQVPQSDPIMAQIQDEWSD